MSTDSSKTKKTSKYKGYWGPLAAILVLIVGLLLGEVFGAVIMGVLIGFFSAGSDIADWLAKTEIQFFYVLISGAVSLLVVWLFMGWRKINWRTPGFKRLPTWKDLGLSALSLPMYFGALMIISAIAGALLGVDTAQEQEIGFENAYGAIALALTFISLVILPPIIEEILFRGFLFTGLRNKLKLWPAAIITSILFAIPHLFASSEGLLWIAGIDTFILSLFLCYLRERTGNLWAPIILHALKNGIAFFAIFVIGL